MQVFIQNYWFYALLVLSGLQLLVFFIVYFKSLVQARKIEIDEKELEPLSVIVVARNECSNLRELIPMILEQDYPQFELIVVDDHSWDGTYEFLHEQLPLDDRLKVVLLDDFVQSKPGKKLGLTLGIKKASHDRLVFTDADCRPIGKDWLKSMASAWKEDKQVILGYSPYVPSGNVASPFIQFEAFHVGWQYLSMALIGRPYMGVGRNMAYSKTLFLENKGFASHLSIPYGDDDLFIQEVAKRSNTAVRLQVESHVTSLPKKSFSKWFQQKRRHLSAGVRYRFLDKLILSFFWLSRFAYYLGLTLYLVLAEYSVIGLVIAGFPLLVWWLAGMTMHLRFKFFKLWPAFPLLDIVYHCIIYPIFGLSTLLNPVQNKWT